MLCYYSTSKSWTFQYSIPPEGSGLAMINGIDLFSNSIMAIMRPSIIDSSTGIEGAAPLFICSALEPITLAFSYFVSIGRVV